MDARERGVTSVESLPGSDIAVELARIFSRLDSKGKERQEPGRLRTGGQMEPSRDLYRDGFGSMGQAPRPNVIMGIGIGGQTSGFFAKRGGVHSPGARAW